MIQTIDITPTLMVSAQPTVEDLAGLADAGVKTVICNRPDDEQPGQPSMDEIESALTVQGIRLVRYPVNPATFPGDDLPGLAADMAGSDGKVLAYCRTGTRSANLWVMTHAPAERAAAIEAVRALGVDVSLAERHSA